jgi:hypothetical protein
MVVIQSLQEMKIIALLFLITLQTVKTEDYIETPDGEIPIDEVSAYPGKFTLFGKI